MGRPKNIRKTTSKTYSLYEDNISEMLDLNGVALGKTPKDIFDLGILALKSGWSPHRKSKEIENLNDRIQKLALMLNTYTSKFDRLLKIVEKGLNLEIDNDLSNLKDIENKINGLIK